MAFFGFFFCKLTDGWPDFCWRASFGKKPVKVVPVRGGKLVLDAPDFTMHIVADERFRRRRFGRHSMFSMTGDGGFHENLHEISIAAALLV
jgi:hypothetical protein